VGKLTDAQRWALTRLHEHSGTLTSRGSGFTRPTARRLAALGLITFTEFTNHDEWYSVRTGVVRKPFADWRATLTEAGRAASFPAKED
jgi:hypothetical protein